MHWRRAIMTVLVAGVAAGWTPAQSPAPPSAAARVQRDEQILREHDIPCDETGLLQFFRDRTLSPAQIAELAKDIQMLGSSSYRIRKQAHDELLKKADAARAVLREALSGPDMEVVRRVELCLRHLGAGPEASLASAAARLVAQRKPSGAAEVLLKYLPFAPDSAVIDEIQAALTAVAVREGNPEPVVLAALDHQRPNIRGVAAEALIRNGVLDSPRALLKDPDASVRLQTARAFAFAKDKAAVAVLIDLLAELSGQQREELEELLVRLAGDEAPADVLDGKTPPGKTRDAWRLWWKTHEATADLGRLEKPALRGLTLIAQLDTGKPGLNGRVFERNPDGSLGWEISGLRYPLDAQVIRKDRVLICEYLSHRVTERDFKGNILWEHPVDMPIAAERLPNGQTFIASRRALFVVDRAHQALFAYTPESPSIAAGCRFRDGQFMLVTAGGECQRIDVKGKVVSSFTAGPVYTMGGNIEALPNGHVLVPQWRDHRVVEYDVGGNACWSVNITQPMSVMRLANGHTLVLSGQRAVELNADGQEVWSDKIGDRPWRVRRR